MLNNLESFDTIPVGLRYPGYQISTSGHVVHFAMETMSEGYLTFIVDFSDDMSKDFD
jgi:hypothetical protein